MGVTKERGPGAAAGTNAGKPAASAKPRPPSSRRPLQSRTPAKPDAPATAPAKKDAPRTMRELRLATEGKKKPSTTKTQLNPLREGLRLERVPDPATFVLFGATGDLAHRKVLPALYHLWRTHLLPHEFMVVAMGRRDYTDEMFREGMRESLANYSRVLPIDLDVCDELCQRVVYHRCDFADPAGYASLVERLDKIDEERGTRGNRLFYLATQPSAFAEIVAQLGRVGLDHERHEGGWRRVVIEKPFGRDLDSAVRLNREVGKVFRERQVYRIDHYLGKETVRNLLVFRFANGIFEPIWNRRHIDHVQITVAESIGIENRGAFYEETGASRDFLQNHLLQLLSLVAMEPPATFEADALRDEKVKVLRAITELSPEQTHSDVVRGQYGPGWVNAKPVMGYRSEPEVDPAIGDRDVHRRPAHGRRLALVRTSRSTCGWASGCRSARRRSRSSSRRSRTGCSRTARRTPRRTCSRCASSPTRGSCCASAPRCPGLGIDVRNVTMDFTYGSAFQIDSPDAYETLILDALLGDASLFTRADEVEEAWSIVDPILDTWASIAGARVPELRRRHLGPRGRRRPAGTGGTAVAPDLNGGRHRRRRSPGRCRSGRTIAGRGDRDRDATGGRRADRARRGPATGRADAALDVAGAVDRGHRAGAGPDLGPAEPRDRRRRRGRRGRPAGRPAHRRPDLGDEPRRRRPPARGRRAERRDDQPPDRPPPVADARRPGRGPGRAALDRRADPGALRDAAGGRPRDLHRADLPDRRRRDGSPPVRAGRPAPRPRPPGHDLVAGRAAAPVRGGPRPAGGHGPVRHRRVHLVGRRRRAPDPAGRPVRRVRAALDQRLRRSSGRRAGGRRSRRSSTTPTSSRSCTPSAGSR